MRNQYKVLEEKYTLEVEATTKEKAIYDTKALTKNFVPTAINIYKTQVEPVIKSWPDFDIMTDTNFNHNIITNPARAVGLIDRILYHSLGLPPVQPKALAKDLNGILERWFVYHLHTAVYDVGIKPTPIDFYKAAQNSQIPPQKSNADFIQYLINVVVQKMEEEYKNYYQAAVKSGDLEDWKRAQELNQKNAQATGGDWNPQGLAERYDIVREDDIIQQDLDKMADRGNKQINALQGKKRT
jgi:hypothetical protein